METMLSPIEEIAFKEQCLIIDPKGTHSLKIIIKILSFVLKETILS